MTGVFKHSRHRLLQRRLLLQGLAPLLGGRSRRRPGVPGHSMRALTCASAAIIASLLACLQADAGVLNPNSFSSLGTLDVSSGSITIDTDALTISGAVSFNGVVDNQGGMASPGVASEIAVFTFDDISLSGATTITVTGSRALALLSYHDAFIDVGLSVNGQGNGALVSTGSLKSGGPGGFAGGFGTSGAGPGGGGFTGLTSGSTHIQGASGGFGSDGHAGAPLTFAGAAGSSYGNLMGLLQGGSGGGGAQFSTVAIPNQAGGGGGGGALEVGAVDAVIIGPNGKLEANGGTGDEVGLGGLAVLDGGNGSGGGIRVHARAFENYGTVSARGGDSVLPNAQREGGGGRVLIEGVGASLIVGEPANYIPSVAGIDVSPGNYPPSGGALNQGVLSIVPALTVVPMGRSYELGSPSLAQAASTTQPQIDFIAGNLQASGGELMVPAGGYSNAFSIELRFPTARITGPATLTNAGELQGSGTVEVPVVNIMGGQINAVSDQLTFVQAVTSNAGAQVNAINSTLVFPGDGIPTSLGGDNSDGLTNHGDFTLIGTTVNGDVNSPAGSNIYVGGTGVEFNGLVSGGGNFPGVGAVTFNGGYAPGDSPAQVSLSGDVSFGAGNTLFVELGGTDPGTFDQLLIAGDALIAGELNVQLLSPFTLSPGQQFAVIDQTGTLSGEFNGLSEGDLVGNYGGVDLFISYQNSVTLFTVPEPSAAILLLLGVAPLLYRLSRRRHSTPKYPLASHAHAAKIL